MIATPILLCEQYRARVARASHVPHFTRHLASCTAWPRDRWNHNRYGGCHCPGRDVSHVIATAWTGEGSCTVDEWWRDRRDILAPSALGVVA